MDFKGYVLFTKYIKLVAIVSLHLHELVTHPLILSHLSPVHTDNSHADSMVVGITCVCVVLFIIKVMFRDRGITGWKPYFLRISNGFIESGGKFPDL